MAIVSVAMAPGTTGPLGGAGKIVEADKTRERDDPEQSERFLEAAREHGAATTEEEATRAFRKVVWEPERKG